MSLIKFKRQFGDGGVGIGIYRELCLLNLLYYITQ
jgi:hypothetical protein